MLACEVHPLTPERWSDLETLFGQRGAYGGCWCMWWRLPRKQFEAQQGEQNKAALHEIVTSGPVPGLLAYVEGQPAGWVSIRPREEFSALERSRVLKRVDDRPVWSIVCFYIGKNFRRQGLMQRLIQSAVDYAAQHGAEIVEGYPIDPGGGEYPSVYAYTGLATAFKAAGFEEAARRSEKRPVMRYFVSKQSN